MEEELNERGIERRTRDIDTEISEYSPLVLAYMGDAVLELFTRKRIIGNGDCKPSQLNITAKSFVTAISQSSAVDKLLPMLTEKELAIYKRGRNTKGKHTPKSAGVIEYRRATGMEALFGYLYLTGNVGRAELLFLQCYDDSLGQ